MKIAYISYPAFADCDYPLIRSLRSLGHNVRYYLILTPYHCHSTLIDIHKLIMEYRILDGDSYQELSVYDEYMKSSTIKIVNFGGNNKMQMVFLWEKLRREIKAFSPDIVHLTNFLPPYGFPLYMSFRKKLIITVHDPVPHIGEESSWNEKLRRIGIRYVKGVVFLSNNNWLKNEFIKRYNVSGQKIYYSKLAPYDPLTVVPRSCLKFYSNFLFIGRISPYKGLDTLLSAIDILRERKNGVGYRLIIAGAGILPFDIERYAQRNDIMVINRYITITELVSMIQDTEYVVCPYKEATQSGVIMSAFALNRPVIATRVGDFETVVKNGENGFLIEPDNAEELADVMDRVLKMPSGYLQNRMAARNMMEEWNNIAYRYIEIYRDILT